MQLAKLATIRWSSTAKQLADAVSQAGYHPMVVNGVDDPSAKDLPILTCSVEKFKFKNFTWFFPLVFNWGKVVMNVSVVTSDGKTLWTKQYKGKGRGWYSFTPPVRKALTKILNEMVIDFTSPEFKQKIATRS